jgi:phosphatidylglycerophosphatase A
MTTSPERGSRQRRINNAQLKDPVQFLALGFGSGLAPFAPGTFGSVVGLVLAWAVAIPGFAFAAFATLLVTIAGFWICGEAARRLGVHDHPAIVWDEIAGMMITMLAAPTQWWGWIAGFLLFRLFDIAKPWPIREIDHGIGGGAGIMLDDIVAGILAALVLMLVRNLT